MTYNDKITDKATYQEWLGGPYIARRDSKQIKYIGSSSPSESLAELCEEILLQSNKNEKVETKIDDNQNFIKSKQR